MTQATHYTRTTGFADDERNNAGGRSTVVTADVDFELDTIGGKLNLTIDNLALLQRDDGVMRDGAVPVSALGSDTLKILTTGTSTPRGAWLTATAYAIKDLVTQSGNTYICVVAHTSGTFAADLAAVKWILFQIGANPNAVAIPFTPTANILSTNMQAALAEVDTNARSRDTQEATDLADTTTAAKNSGLIGFNYALTYVAGTIGRWLKDLATSAGAAFIGFGQSGTGASTRTVQAELRWRVSAEQFGAVGDGATDCYAAITAAFTAFPTCQLCFGAGTFVVSAPIDKPVGASIKGQGRGVTRIKMKNSANAASVIRTAGFAALTGTTSLGGEFNSEISDLTIDGNKANNAAGLGVQYYGKYFVLNNVAIESCFGIGIYTEYAGSDDFTTPLKTLEARLSSVFVQQCGGSGIKVLGPHDMTMREIVSFSNSGWGLEIYTAVHGSDINTYLNTSGGFIVDTTTLGATTFTGSVTGTDWVGSTAAGTGAYLKAGGNTLSASSFGGPTALRVDANNNIVQGTVANSTAFGLLLSGANAQGVFDLVMYSNAGVIFGVSTASLKSQVRAFMGDATGTLQNGGFPGTWQISGYTGFSGSGNQLYGGTTFAGGRLCPPTTGLTTGAGTQGLFFDTSIPVSGTFNRGDRISNSSPTVGSPKGWICTVTGTPGTWVSEGNL